MTSAHNTAGRWLHFEIQRQLPFSEFQVGQEGGRVALPSGSHYVPDLVVIPHQLAQLQLRDRGLETFSKPLPLVVEIWSKSTGAYDVEEKLVEYQRRGDLEIWRIHPYEFTLTSWVRQEDGSYLERVLTSGSITCAALPVTISLDDLFALL